MPLSQALIPALLNGCYEQFDSHLHQQVYSGLCSASLLLFCSRCCFTVSLMQLISVMAAGALTDGTRTSHTARHKPYREQRTGTCLAWLLLLLYRSYGIFSLDILIGCDQAANQVTYTTVQEPRQVTLKHRDDPRQVPTMMP